MKETAVEWLENEFKEAHKMFGGIDTNWIKRFDQAKAIEKEQSINLIFKYIEDNLDPSTHGNIENVKEWFELNKSEI